jgi:hypothetical protein
VYASSRLSGFCRDSIRASVPFSSRWSAALKYLCAPHLFESARVDGGLGEGGGLAGEVVALPPSFSLALSPSYLSSGRDEICEGDEIGPSGFARAARSLAYLVARDTSPVVRARGEPCPTQRLDTSTETGAARERAAADDAIAHLPGGAHSGGLQPPDPLITLALPCTTAAPSEAAVAAEEAAIGRAQACKTALCKASRLLRAYGRLGGQQWRRQQQDRSARNALPWLMMKSAVSRSAVGGAVCCCLRCTSTVVLGRTTQWLNPQWELWGLL